MRTPHRQSIWSPPFPALIVAGCCAVLTGMLSSCTADLPVQHEAQQGREDSLETRYSIVCIIHGDGDYVYHDTGGNEYNADEEAAASARRIGEQNPYAEVFIFHQKPRRHVLFVFPLRDGEFTYYRNGKLTAHESYWRDEGQSPFDPEVALYRRFRSVIQNGEKNVFLYCGHEIPESGGMGYDASYPDRPFAVPALARALRGFTRDSVRSDLIVLSTCYGGTPYTIGTLGSSARYIIASPGNLHLSYFDLRPLERLDVSMRDGDVAAFAGRFARQTFDRLAGDIQTAVSVAVYDVERVQGFLDAVQGAYEHALTSMRGETQATLATMEHCDCAHLPTYALPAMGEGVAVFYRPARFGRLKDKLHHSGWECWKERESQVAPSPITKPALMELYAPKDDARTERSQ